MAEKTSRISCVIGTAGHVDHGKTSLVRALTGMDTDRLPEEKRRGLSIELGFAYIDFDGKEGETIRAAIVDVPGHERFVRNMLAGVTGIDMALFCVAADDGVMPQTIEHLDILKLLSVRSAVFAVTKCDRVAEGRVIEVEEAIRGLIKGSPLAGAPLIRVSTVTGAGIDGLKRLIKESLVKRAPSPEGFFRLPVDRSFSIAGFGAVVTGTVASGAAKKGDELICFPTGARVKVRGLQSLHLEAGEVSVGQRAALNISGLKSKDVGRGSIIASLELSGFASSARGPLNVDCSFEFIHNNGKPGFAATDVVKNSGILKVYHLAGETLARIILPDRIDPALPVRSIRGRLVLRKPLMMMRGDRFILRDPSINSTIGGGVVEWPCTSRYLRPLQGNIAGLPDEPLLFELLAALLPEGGVGLDVKTLSMMLNVRECALRKAVALDVPSSGGFFIMGNFAVSAARAGALKKKITDALGAYHAVNPMDAGMTGFIKDFTKEVSAGIGEEKGKELLRLILEGMAAEGLIRQESGSIALPAHRPGVTGGAEGLLSIEGKITGLFDNAGFTPPRMEDMERLPYKKEEIEKVMGYLRKKGAIVKLREGSFISGKAVDTAKEKMTGLIRKNGSLRAAEFRDSLGCGRKLAIEILEYFDKERVTLRHGDTRTLR
ncbi:MAG: selenocysteine-specific translation elongation factor [Deltaproteobacteria bacterium]|nr:selenocysteine-specific translation elongation factor [Deltaproteobacteria bacterium]